MDINEFVKLAGHASKIKGFRDNPVELGTLLMLTVSEVSEALEADRKNKWAKLDAFNNAMAILVPDGAVHTKFQMEFNTYIKDTFEDEIADAVIRLADICDRYHIDLEQHILLKMRFNALRPHKHGKDY